MSSFVVVKNDFGKVARDLHVGSKVAEDRAAARIVAKARAAAPTLTGRLRASIRHDGGAVYTDVSYSRYQEYGTRHMEAHPFFFQAVEDQLRPFEMDLFAILKRHS
jgi:HK97 gp10 family phage protein